MPDSTWIDSQNVTSYVLKHTYIYILQPFDRAYIDNPGPMVVFATPGMLHAGLSLQIFKKWAEDEKNMVRKWLQEK